MWYRNKTSLLSISFWKGCSILIIIFACCTLPVKAQNHTSSPYSFYGLGELSSTTEGISSALGGTVMSFRGSNNLNVYNPASLAGIDSLKFIFNIGLSSKFTKMDQNGESDSFNDNNLTQVAFGFRVSPLVYTAVTLVPFTNVGYEITALEEVVGSDDFFQRTHIGSGGLNKLILTNGFAISEHLHLGINAIYLFGNITKDEILTMSGSSYVYKSQEQLISQGVYGNIGLQYFKDISSEWELAIGAKFQPKLGVNSKREANVTNFLSSLGDTIHKETLGRGEFDIPMSYALGLGFTKNKQLWIGADYLHEKWGDTKIFKGSSGLENRTRLSLGANYIANDGYATRFLEKLTYRFGVFYDTGYIKVRNERIKTKGVSLGLGIPMARQKGAINLSFEFGRMGTTTNNNIREDFGRITVGLSLFERWFIKRKYQ